MSNSLRHAEKIDVALVEADDREGWDGSGLPDDLIKRINDIKEKRERQFARLEAPMQKLSNYESWVTTKLGEADPLFTWNGKTRHGSSALKDRQLAQAQNVSQNKSSISVKASDLGLSVTAMAFLSFIALLAPGKETAAFVEFLCFAAGLAVILMDRAAYAKHTN